MAVWQLGQAVALARVQNYLQEGGVSFPLANQLFSESPRKIATPTPSS